jgi:hypothetical protein
VDGIARLQLLSRDECHAVRAAIVELRPCWEQRSPEYPFFTLGAASYLDAPGDRRRYHAKAREMNPLLARHFGWLYQKLADLLASHFGAPVTYPAELALPGCHIYLSHPVFERPIASIHCDTQYRLLDWTGVTPADFKAAMSFTLSIALPQCGAGLRVWPVHHDEIAGENLQALVRRAGNKSPDYFRYELGQLALHSGHMVHQAAPAERLIESDERMTLQGHALLCQGSWMLYW